MNGTDALARSIAAHLADWETAHVELATFGSDDPLQIALHIDGICEHVLGSSCERPLFYQSSIGSVSGLALRDGRRVVVKVHQPTRSLPLLRDVVRVQQHLARLGLFATTVLAGPLPLALGHAVLERYEDRGTLEDGHRPAIRRALARALGRMVVACRPFVEGSMLEGDPMRTLEEELWPAPHSRLFDFVATRAGAEAIDALAASARAQADAVCTAGERVIGHGDWRAEHVRFEHDAPVIAFDWDSLCIRREPALVGYSAHAFCADWSRVPAVAPAPTLAEARAFVVEYEAERGRPFDSDERRLCAAAFAYACAYSARCAHALRPADEAEPGTFANLVATEGMRLLAL